MTDSFELMVNPIIERLRDVVEDYLRIKYYGARRAYEWDKADMPPPPSGDFESWSAWWESLYMETLDDYIRECQKTDMRTRVRDFELEKYGHSALEDPKA